MGAERSGSCGRAVVHDVRYNGCEAAARPKAGSIRVELRVNQSPGSHAQSPTSHNRSGGTGPHNAGRRDNPAVTACRAKSCSSGPASVVDSNLRARTVTNMSDKAPKGRNHRCAKRFYVGGVPTVPGELVWRVSDGAIERVRSPSQLDGTEVLVVTTGAVPTLADFGGTPGAGVWAAPTSPDAMLRSAQRGTREQLTATISQNPALRERVSATVTATRPRFDPLAGSPDAAVAVSLAADIAAEGGRALVVGGAVRDRLAGVADSKDIDIEVFGIAPGRLEELLARRGRVDLTGARFAVYKVHGTELDVSLPRTERKDGTGHRGFIVDADPSLSPERAALRRDFTMNAISFDVLTGEVLDPVGGAADLEAGVLRHVSDQFGEDPLRVLRGAQFAARFGLTAHPDTLAMCRSLRAEADTLATQPVFDEWSKMMLRGKVPGEGLRFLDQVDWIDHWAELAELRDVQQDPKWHPEGDVFVHTAHALDAWARFRDADQDPTDALTVAMAILCHDLGKPATTETVDGRIRAHAHEKEGVEPTRALLADMCPLADMADRVVPLVEHHLAPVQLHAAGAGDAAVRRLANKVGRIDLLVEVSRADQGGRPPLVVDTFEAGDWLLERAAALGVKETTLKPFVGGRDLIGLGLKPGPVFSEILAEVFEAQTAGTVTSHSAGVTLAEEVAAARGLLG